MLPESRSPRPADLASTGHCAILLARAQLLVVNHGPLCRVPPPWLPHVKGELPTVRMDHLVPILTVQSLNRIQSQALKSSSPATCPGPFPSSEEPELGRGEARATLHLRGPMLRQPLVPKGPSKHGLTGPSRLALSRGRAASCYNPALLDNL